MGRDRSRLHRLLQADSLDLGSVHLSRALCTPRRLSAKQKPIQRHPMEPSQPLKIARVVLVDQSHVLRPGDDAEHEIRR